MYAPLITLRLYLLWSLMAFGVRLGVAVVATQRALLVIFLFAAAILLSAVVTHTLIVQSANELALAPLSPTVVREDDSATEYPLEQTGAKTLWNYYKLELQEHAYNRAVLGNLIVLASVLSLEKDVSVYQRQLYLADPLRACVFSSELDGRLQITCPTPQL